MLQAFYLIVVTAKLPQELFKEDLGKKIVIGSLLIRQKVAFAESSHMGLCGRSRKQMAYSFLRGYEVPAEGELAASWIPDFWQSFVHGQANCYLCAEHEVPPCPTHVLQTE